MLHLATYTSIAWAFNYKNELNFNLSNFSRVKSAFCTLNWHWIFMKGAYSEGSL